LVGAADGKLYAIGGVIDPSGSQILQAVEAYDPVTNSWMDRASMPRRRENFGAAVGPDGRIYIFGGLDYNRVFPD
jgi:N-acetylneuraminic acid mutarotase